MSDGEEFELRQEAGVLSWGALTDEQKQAGAQVFALIRKMVASPEKVDKPSQSYLPRIDSARYNRVLLIDGGRGSGKTALLLTLLERWRRGLGEGEESNTPGVLDPNDPWRDAGQRIVPVGLLDLHPLPRSTNLLLHVVGRFERVVTWLEGDGKAENEPAAWHFTAAGELESRKKWNKLLRAVAAGWDGSVEQRSGRLDIEAYAVELAEAEHQRLDVVSTFTAFIDALAEDFRVRQNPRKKELPLFVLAVDDADMNPRRSVELLDVLRMLWHPRLAFLLTGHSELFRQTLAEHFLGELRHPLRGHMVLESEIAPVRARPVQSLTNEVYDKTIPNGHRCCLVPIPPGRRLDDPRTTLRKCFGEIHVEPRATRKGPSLADYFGREEQLCEALPDRLRGLIDLTDQARMELGRKPAGADDGTARVPYEPASYVVEALYRNALQMSSLSGTEYFDAVRVNERTGALEIKLARTGPGFEAVEHRLVASYTENAPSPKIPLRGAEFRVIDRIEAYLEGGELMPRAVTAALMLAADVSADQAKASWRMPKTERSGYERVFAVAQYQPLDADAPLRFPWPLPPDFTLPFYAAISSRWKVAIDAKGTPRNEPRVFDADTVDELARHFVLLAVYLWSGFTELWVETKPPAWEALAEFVVTLMQKAGTAWKTWAYQRAGLLAAPEYGLPAKSAVLWLDALKKRAAPDQWKRLCEGLRVERRDRVKAAGIPNPERFITEVNEIFPDHKWIEMIDAQSVTVARQEQVTSSIRQPLAPALESEKSPLLELKTTLTAIGVKMPMSVSTTEGLAAMGNEKLKALVGAIAPYKEIAGAAPQALAHLWQAAANLCGQMDVATAIRVRNKALMVAPVVVSHAMPDAKSRTTNPVEVAPPFPARIDAGRIVAYVWQVPEHSLTLSRSVLGRELTALYEFISDIIVRSTMRTRRKIEPIYPSWWPGVNVDYPSHAVQISWPTPRWLLFSQMRRVASLWNTLVEGTRPGGMFQSQQWIDALAYSLIERSSELFGDADQMEKQRLHPNASAKQWADVVDQALRKNGSSGVVGGVMTEWLYGLYLMATPESGLSVGAAKAILDELEREEQTGSGAGAGPRYQWFLGDRASTLKSDRSPIFELRRKRLTDAGLGKQNADSILRAIDEDAKNAEHPWIKLFPVG